MIRYLYRRLFKRHPTQSPHSASSDTGTLMPTPATSTVIPVVITSAVLQTANLDQRDSCHAHRGDAASGGDGHGSNNGFSGGDSGGGDSGGGGDGGGGCD